MMPTPPLAYHDPRFLDSDEARPIRIVSEYLAPLEAFRAANVAATVVFFGSARARVGGVLGRYVEEATELARLVTEWSRSELNGRLIVCSGGDRKSTRLNSSHSQISYAVFCLKKKNTKNKHT